MPELPELPEIHEIHHHAHGDRFGRVIAIATVLTTLMASGVAVLQANAVRRHELASGHAQELAAQGLGKRAAGEGAARVQLERFELAEQQRARAGLRRQELLFATGDRANVLRTEARRWLSVAAETEKTSEDIAHEAHALLLEPDGEFGPAEDPHFPLRFLAQSRKDYYEIAAERSAANREATRAQAQYAAYAVSFTMLAIAVFLFGYSLTPHGQPRRRLFAGSASTFVAVAATYAIGTALTPPKEPSHEAAKAYAAGEVAADSSEHEEAVKQFTKAIEEDPELPEAYIGRAQAMFLAHAPRVLASGTNITTPDALEAVIEDEREARSLGVRDPLFFAELGADLVALGLRRQDSGLVEEAEEHLERATAHEETDAQASFDLALARLYLHDEAGADRAYEQAIERTVYIDDHGHKSAREDPLTEEEYLAVGLEGLENLRQYGGREYEAVVVKTKPHLVAAYLEQREKAAAAAHAEEEAGHGAAEGGHGKEEAGGHGEEKPTGDHGEKPAGDHGEKKPADDHGEEKPADDHGEEKPADDHGEKGASAEGHAEKTATEDHGDEKPADDHGDDKPAGDHGEEKAEKSPRVPLHDVKIELSPSHTYFDIPTQEGFDPTHDVLTVQWYYQDPRKLGWTILTEVSAGGQPPLDHADEDGYHERAPYLSLTQPASCLPAGEYMLELYVNGFPAARVRETVRTEDVAATLRGLETALCVPTDWKHSGQRTAGLVDGYTSKEGTAGAYVFNLTPALVGTGDKLSQNRAGEILDRILERFGGELLPARPRAPHAEHVELPSLPGALVRRYRLGEGSLLAAVGKAPNGQLLVDLVYGPEPFFRDGSAERVFASLSDRT